MSRLRKIALPFSAAAALAATVGCAAQSPQDVYARQPTPVKGGLIGAGVGAAGAAVSGGDIAQGALIGAGAGVIGGAVYDVAKREQPRPLPPPGYYGGYPYYR